MKKRYIQIDILRGIAILAMILTHTSYYFFSDKVAFFTWNWTQFAVPALIFCFSYIFYQKNINSPSISLSYFRKRIIRLLYPYYIFLIIFLALVFFITQKNFTTDYVIQSIFLTGGVSINWLVLLFIYMTIIFPFIAICFKRYRSIFIIYALLSIASTIIFTFYQLPRSCKIRIFFCIVLNFWIPGWNTVFQVFSKIAVSFGVLLVVIY